MPLRTHYGHHKLFAVFGICQMPIQLIALCREELEEIELMLRLRGEGGDPEIKKELKARKGTLDQQITTLNSFLAALEDDGAEEVDLEAAAAAEAEAEAKKKREGNCGEYTKMGVAILKNTISGRVTGLKLESTPYCMCSLAAHGRVKLQH